MMIDDHGEKLFEWVDTSPGGYVNKKQQVRRDAKTGVRGVYVTASVKKGEVLATLPWSALISGEKPGDTSFCDTIAETAREMSIVATADRHNTSSQPTSTYGPYAELLYATRDGFPLFRDDAESLLMKVVGRYLPPRPERINFHLTLWRNACGGVKGAPVVSTDPARNLQLFEHAAILVQTRAEWVLGSVSGERMAVMVPIYDMYNHRNGKYNNMQTDGTIGGKYTIRASRDIEAGEQVYNTYGQSGTWVTFNNFGFVEDYPQRWTFDLPPMYGGGSIDFLLDEVEERGQTSDTEMQQRHNTTETDMSRTALVRWNGSPPSASGIKFLVRELDRLGDIRKRYLNRYNASSGTIGSSLQQVWEYHSSLTDAISEAVQAAGGIYVPSNGSESAILTWPMGMATLCLAAFVGRLFLSLSRAQLSESKETEGTKVRKKKKKARAKTTGKR
mmetsp:Transcript_6235/g.13590  ORF Transcript_6235/g.13590 Transcript_6235/m.13590 type:complete len:446 (-) Transcript_6235:1424-2761(-)